MDLNVTLAILAGELLLLGFCYWQDRKPVVPGKVRMIPYRLIMLVLVVVILTTLAHLIALVTGQPVQARRKMGM